MNCFRGRRSPLPLLLVLLVAGLLATPADAQRITVGEGSACSALAGVANCWGTRGGGSLGDGLTQPNSYDPVVPAGLTAGVTAISSTQQGGGSSDHTCAIVDGGVRCWGVNGSGEAGDGTVNESKLTPVAVSGLGSGSGVTAVDTATLISCAVVAGSGRCWGDVRSRFAAGPSVPTPAPTPVDVGGAADVRTVAPGWRHACILRVSGAVGCTAGAHNANGAPSGSAGTPILANGGATTKLVSGVDYSCALVSGAVKCWGAYYYLGRNATEDSPTAANVVGLESGVTDVDANWEHACAIKAGEVFCWGQGGSGQLGDGRALSNGSVYALTPVKVVGLTGVTQIAVGTATTCALVGADDQRWCWGSNGNGQLGNDTVPGSYSLPARVIGSTPKPPAAPTQAGTSPPAQSPIVRPATPTTSKPKARPKPTIKRASSKARKVGKRRTVTVATLACPAGSACAVKVPKRITLKVKGKAFKLTVTAPRSIRAGRKAGVSLKLPKAAFKRLKGRKATVKLTLSLGATKTTVRQAITR